MWNSQNTTPSLAALCRLWAPRAVAAEAGHPRLADNYRRYPEIGEIHWLATAGKDKLQRALPAILLGENRRILLPEAPSSAEWKEEFTAYLGDPRIVRWLAKRGRSLAQR